MQSRGSNLEVPFVRRIVARRRIKLGAEDDLGSIQPGKTADVVVIGGNPLSDASVLENVQIVIKGGELVFDARE